MAHFRPLPDGAREVFARRPGESRNLGQTAFSWDRRPGLRRFQLGRPAVDLPPVGRVWLMRSQVHWWGLRLGDLVLLKGGLVKPWHEFEVIDYGIPEGHPVCSLCFLVKPVDQRAIIEGETW